MSNPVPAPPEAGFLAALDAEPADRTARLAYADWLEERDRPGPAAAWRLTASRGWTPVFLDQAFAEDCARAGIELAREWQGHWHWFPLESYWRSVVPACAKLPAKLWDFAVRKGPGLSELYPKPSLALADLAATIEQYGVAAAEDLS